MKTAKQRYDYWTRNRGLSHEEALDSIVGEVALEERGHCLRLIEAPIPGLVELNKKLDSDLTRRTIKVLQEAAQSVRESGEFRDKAAATKGGR